MTRHANTIRRIKGRRWCELRIELSADGRLSISGSKGRVESRAAARKDAREYWTSCFEDSPGELGALIQRFPHARISSPAKAAKFVLDTDGEFHGLDVHAELDRDVLVTASCGQIIDDLRAWFPEVIDLLPWHLNDMRAGCAHQRAAGQTTIGESCDVCGYRYGSAWLTEELPADIRAKAEALINR